MIRRRKWRQGVSGMQRMVVIYEYSCACWPGDVQCGAGAIGENFVAVPASGCSKKKEKHNVANI